MSQRNHVRSRAVEASASRLFQILVGTVVVLAALALSLPSRAQAQPFPDSFAELTERVMPAVVNISTSQTISTDGGSPLPQFPPGTPFDDFFREFFDRHGGQGQGQGPTQRRATSLGSGFIIDPSGYIVTNNHVIEDADEITVILSDDRVLQAEVVGRDSKIDVALLKVESSSPLPFVEFGDSEAARVGDWVIAIGNPFGLGGTVTAGIISAKTRDINSGPYDSFIQTDASINRGNSGGPLFTLDGRVIGINTAIYSPSGGSVGIGFATPSSLAVPVLADLREHGRTRRGWLGVRIQTVTDEIAESLGMDRARGALVAGLTEPGPAAEAGIQPGDIILTFNGQEVREMRRLPALVASTEIDEEVPVVVWRNGAETTLRVTIAELEEEETTTASAPTGGKSDPAAPSRSETALPALGLSVMPITDSTARQRFSLPPDADKGVVISAVEERGPASERGIQPGDVILEINQNPVTSASDLTTRIEEARSASRKSVLLLIQSGSDMRFVPVTLAE